MMIHSRFSERTIYYETGNGSSECVYIFSYLICPWCLLFILVYSFINKYILTLFIVLQILKGQIVCRESMIFSVEDRLWKILLRAVWMRFSLVIWVYEQSIDKESSFIGSLKHTHFVCDLHSHREFGACFSRYK